jgi:hypothetical protein
LCNRREVLLDARDTVPDYAIKEYNLSNAPQNPVPWPRVKPPGSAASILQIILASLLLVISTCAGLLAIYFPRIVSYAADQGMQIPIPQGMSVDTARLSLAAPAILFGGAGVTLLILTFFVRRGSKPSIIASLVLTGLCGFILLLDAVAAMFTGQIGQSFLALPIFLLLIALCGVTMHRLFMLATSQRSPLPMPPPAYWGMMQGNSMWGFNLPPHWIPPPGAPPVGMPPPPSPPTNLQPPASS